MHLPVKGSLRCVVSFTAAIEHAPQISSQTGFPKLFMALALAKLPGKVTKRIFGTVTFLLGGLTEANLPEVTDERSKQGGLELMGRRR